MIASIRPRLVRCFGWNLAGAVAFVGLAVQAAHADQVSAEAKKGLRGGTPEERQAAVRRAVEEGAADAVPLVLPLAANDKDGGVRDVAFTELTKIKTEAAAKHLVEKGLKSRDESMRRIAAEILGVIEAPGVDAALIPLLEDSDRGVRIAAAHTAGFVKAAATREKLIALVDADKDPLVRSVAVESVGRIGGSDVVELLNRWLQSPSESVQVSALHQFWWHDKVRGAEATAEVLGMKELREDGALRPLLVQAIEEAVRYRSKPCLPRLVELLTHPRARARDMAYQSLLEITGLEIPNIPADWLDWWQRQGGRFEIPQKGGSKQQVAQRSQVRFYGIPIVSDRLVFVVDYSGSMNSTGKDGASKIANARKALAEVLNGLPDGTEFNVIAFSTEPRSWRADLQKKNKQNVGDALDFVNRTDVGGWTNVYDSLARAIAMQSVDTVVLLSDGAPSVGEYEYFSRIRHHVRLLNRTRKVAVSAVALETNDDAKRFLKELAKDTGGEFVER
jgi:HEAT repeat protein